MQEIVGFVLVIYCKVRRCCLWYLQCMEIGRFESSNIADGHLGLVDIIKQESHRFSKPDLEKRLLK